MEYDKAVKQTSLSLTILLFAFASGVILFGTVGLALGPLADAPEGLETLRWVAVALPLLELPMAAQIWMMMGKRMAAADDWQQRIAILRGRTIVVAAMFEAPALLGGVVLLLTGPGWHVIPAFALFIGVIAGLLPTPARVQRAIGHEDGRKVDAYS
ncbi:MAG: hypothetical protein K8I27_08090 [Planctomycetes bacterium]|nr:hypothetical protein [Planctomycetota bacterium]